MRLREQKLIFSSSSLMEINNHIFEGMERLDDYSEIEKIQKIITELGNPKNYLKDIVAEHKSDEAIKAYNLLNIISQLYYFSRSVLKYSIFFILYLLAFTILILFFGKIIFPDNVGLFYEQNKFESFGLIKNVNGTTEVLHLWFYPLTILMGILVYLLLTVFAKASKSNKELNLLLKF